MLAAAGDDCRVLNRSAISFRACYYKSTAKMVAIEQIDIEEEEKDVQQPEKQ